MTPEERKQMNLLCTRIQEERNVEAFSRTLHELGELVRRKEERLGLRPVHDARHQNRPRRVLTAIATKILKPLYPDQPEKVEISIQGADDLFREIRITNVLTHTDGSAVGLKEGARVDVVFEAESNDAIMHRQIEKPS